MRTVLLALVFLVAGVSIALACKSSCSNPAPASAAREAGVAFVGTITKTVVTDNCPYPKHPTWCSRSYAYDVDVEGVWKGSVGKTVRVDTGTATGDCSVGKLGRNLDGQRWLFFSKTTPVRIYICSGTQRATPAAVSAITRALGAPAVP